MMKLIQELATEYAPCGFYIDKNRYGRYRLWISGLYYGDFGSLDDIRSLCQKNLRSAREEIDHVQTV